MAWGQDCDGAIGEVGFFRIYRELFDEDTCLSARDGISILAYDALAVFSRAVCNTGMDRPNPDAILRGIGLISGDEALNGASGLIDYEAGKDSAIPKNKAILVLRGEGDAAPKRILLCGELATAKPAPDEC